MPLPRRLWILAAALLLALGAAAFVRTRQQQRQLLIEMETHRQHAEQALEMADWPDQLWARLQDWKKSAKGLSDRKLRQTVLGEILALEQKTKMLARPGVRTSLDAVARALAAAQPQRSPMTNRVTR